MKKKKILGSFYDKIVLQAADKIQRQIEPQVVENMTAVRLDAAENLIDSVNGNSYTDFPKISDLGLKYCRETPKNPVMGDLVTDGRNVKVWQGKEWIELRRSTPDGYVLEGDELNERIEQENSLKILKTLGD